MEKTAVPYDTMPTYNGNSESVLKKCCLCIPLRIGCFILGYASLFSNICRFMMLSVATLNYGLGEDSTFDDDEKTEIEDQEEHVAVTWILVVFAIFDLIWLAINIACLVGIHKRRPGPIKVYIGVATTRFILTLAFHIFAWSAYSGSDGYVIVIRCIDFIITGYFIFVYYLYAAKLDREMVEASEALAPPQGLQDVSFIYPSKLDKEHLVL